MEKMKLELSTYKDKKTGEEKTCYKANCNMRGHKATIDFMPKDPGGYQLLEIIFNGESAVDLEVVKNKFIIDGREIESTKYMATSVDPDGTIYQMEVVPRQDSDKSKLKMYANI